MPRLLPLIGTLIRIWAADVKDIAATSGETDGIAAVSGLLRGMCSVADRANGKNPVVACNPALLT